MPRVARSPSLRLLGDGDHRQRLAGSRITLIRVSRLLRQMADSKGNRRNRDTGAMIIRTLVQSALQTGYLSVESEGLIRQVLAIRGYKSTDMEALQQLYEALKVGTIRRESQNRIQMPPLDHAVGCSPRYQRA